MWSLFFGHPRLLLMTCALIVAGGLSALRFLPRKEDPSVHQRWATVVSRFPGADAERVELLVTEAIEAGLDEFEEIKRTDSTSRAGISIVLIELGPAITDVQTVWSRLRDKLAAVSLQLPPGVSQPELNERGNMDVDAYSLIAALTWNPPQAGPAALEAFPHGLLLRYAEELDDLLRALPGTRHTDIFGDVPEEILVEVDAHELAVRGLGIASLARAIEQGDAKVPAGLFRGADRDLVLEIAGELASLDGLRDLPIHHGPAGDVVRVRDVAQVRRAMLEPAGELAMVGGRPAVTVAARVGPSERIVHWAAEARAQLASFRATLPVGMRLQLIFDQSHYVEQRLGSLAGNLLLGAALVVVMMLFCMGWKSALLVSASLPLSCLMVLAGMQLCGVPLHQISVTGLIIALGMLIDNAIIIVDEVSRALDTGKSPLESVVHATRSMALPLLASTLTTVLAFLPLVLLGGGIGEFVGPLGISLILALGSSLFLSLTVVPALTARWKHSAAKARRGWPHEGLSHRGLTRLYRGMLDRLFAHPLLGSLCVLWVPLLGFFQGSYLEEQFFPPAARDQFQIRLRLPVQSSFDQTWRVAERARALILQEPEISEIVWFVGGAAPKFYYNLQSVETGAAHFAHGLIQLRGQQISSALVRRVQAKLDAFLPEAQAIAEQLQQGPSMRAPVEIFIHGTDLAALYEAGEAQRSLLGRIPGIIHSETSMGDRIPKLVLETGNENLVLSGFDKRGLAQQVQASLEGVLGGSIFEGSRELPVRVRLKASSRRQLEELASIDLVARGSDSPGTVPLGVLGQLRLVSEQASITHRDGQRVNVVRGFTAAGVLPSRVVRRYKQLRDREGGTPLPGLRLELGGEQRQRNEAVQRLLSFAGPLLCLLLAVLVLSFRSFRMAAIVASVALCSVGLAQASLYLFGYPFGFMAIVGTMGLVGIAVNDAIVVLALIRQDPRARIGNKPALREVVLASTRHVLTTSLTTVLGFTPLLLAGGEFWPPLAISISGGVLGATLLALFYVPAAYLLLLRFHMKTRSRRPTIRAARKVLQGELRGRPV